MRFKNVLVIDICGNQKRVAIASTFREKLVGMIGSKKRRNFDFLLIENCNSIHTFFMSEHIDVIFVGDSFELIKVKEKLAPWRTQFCSRAKYVIEGPPLASKHTRSESDDRGAEDYMSYVEIVKAVRNSLKL
ncbi:DUF192 domain-containing protein [Taylorella equigenitalis]|nr:DUF192 domain-containing protein [Taylorella equigenitalis]ASY30603.1 hypothetical protein B9Z30_04360 [Taylorella equigenitalis]ASY37910.1 hypothetical protein CA605_04285 [Taylorella equigenitalis]ASY40897.1 hypothetical protein CAV20_04295 [Taylorella equigenitalis]ASY42331.1 hypothetical protein CA943_04295 [Taylorella equigenitalis]KGK32930.1 hypothetical protein LW90_07385 [Taylorella equigenitalis]